MDDLRYEHQPVTSAVWGAAIVALAATLLLGLDFADLDNPVLDDVGRTTYAAVVAAGATIQPTEPAAPLPIIKHTPPAEVIAMLDDNPIRRD